MLVGQDEPALPDCSFTATSGKVRDGDIWTCVQPSDHENTATKPDWKAGGTIAQWVV